MDQVRNITIFLLALLAGSTAFGQNITPPRVKAAFLYNFIKFVEWPENTLPNPDSPYVIGVIGRDPFGSVLDETMRGKTVNGRTIVVRRVSEAEGRACHLLFISPSERRRLPSIFAQLKTAPVLTVGDTPGFCESGGMINFISRQNKVQFEINGTAATRSNLKIHSTLLSLAK